MKKIPSKEEVKSKYGISEEDFEILTEMPTPDRVAARSGFLIKIADAFGFKSWMVRSIGGAVLAVIFLVPEVIEKYEFWKTPAAKAYTSFESALAYLSQDHSYTEIELVPFAQQTQESIIGKSVPPMDQFPLSTGVMPVLPMPPSSEYPDLV